jgi:hypothetical protein
LVTDRWVFGVAYVLATFVLGMLLWQAGWCLGQENGEAPAANLGLITSQLPEDDEREDDPLKALSLQELFVLVVFIVGSVITRTDSELSVSSLDPGSR